MHPRIVAVALLSLAVVTVGTGCADNKMKAERASLLKQNQDLAAQLEQERADRAAAEARANTPPMAAPTDNSAAAGAPDMAPLPPAADTGSMGAGVTEETNASGEHVIHIAGDVLFDSGKAALKPAAKRSLDAVAAKLKSTYGGSQLRIEGHTDPRPVRKSGWDDNWDLGGARARTVLLYLIQRGVPKRDMYMASFADNDLKSTKNLALDRRVDIVVVRNGK